MNIKYDGQYRSTKTGNLVFRYAVSGTAEEMKEYAKVQGKQLRRNDNNEPLFFTVNFVGQAGKLIITSKGKAVADMSAMEQMASLVSQFDGKFAEALAQQAVAQLLGSQPTATPGLESKASTEVEEQSEDLDEL